MRTSAILVLLVVSAAQSACSDAKLSPIQRQDSGPAIGTVDGAGTTDTVDTVDTVGSPDLTAEPLVCEPAGTAICAPSACASVCHTRQASAGPGLSCTVFSGTNPSRYDDCASGNVCLSDGFGTSNCFALCRTAVDCIGGRACASRTVDGASAIQVCDPPYQNCSSASEPCCDPVAKDSCGTGRYCYLVPPPPGSADSWTVCDYVTGGGPPGQLCTTSRDCLQGLACFLPGSAPGECRLVCDPKDATSCSPGTCTPYGKQWGVCSG